MTDHPSAIAEREAIVRWSRARWIGKFLAGFLLFVGGYVIGMDHGRDFGHREMRCSIMAVLWEMHTEERNDEKPPSNCADYLFERGDHLKQEIKG